MARLHAAVSTTAARRLGLPEPSLEIGARADLLVIRRELTEAHAGDVALVVADGVPRVLDPSCSTASPQRSATAVIVDGAGGAARWAYGEFPARSALPQRSTTPVPHGTSGTGC